MNYCVLIELSQTQVTFSAYAGGEGGFVPYGEVNRPLAVWFSGSNVVIGKDAQIAALNHQPNAFTDLFNHMKLSGNFYYANETHDYNKLLLFTLKAGLREFFVQKLYNSQGSLEDYVAHVPLLLMFGPDMEENTCAVVMSQMKNNGFGNVRRVYENEYILRYLSHQAHPDSKVILSSDGNTLYGEKYATTKKECSFLLPNAGKDPRVEKLVELIWERCDARYNWLDFQNEKMALLEAANRFIRSGVSTLDDTLLLSDGNSYSYFLDKNDLSLFNNPLDAQILDALNCHLNGIDKENCCVVLKGMAVNNKYLYELLASEYPHLVRLDDTQQKVALQQLLDECKQMNFVFTSESLPAGNSEPRSPFPGPVVPSGKDKRDFRQLKATVRTCRKNGENAHAKSLVAAFRQQMHDKGIFAFDCELDELLKAPNVDIIQQSEPDETTESTLRPPSPTQPSGKDYQQFRMLKATVQTLLNNGDIAQIKSETAEFCKVMHAKGIKFFDAEIDALKNKAAGFVQPPRAAEPSSKDKREFRILSAMVNAYINQGNCRQATSEIDIFRKQMHEKGITAFDQDLDNLIAHKGCDAPSPKPMATQRSAQKENADEGTMLMRSGKIKEAGEWFQKNGEPAKANECKRLKLWMRYIVPYKNDIAPTAASHNRTKAVSRAKEIEEYIAICKRYGMDASDLIKMANEYKKIN